MRVVTPSRRRIVMTVLLALAACGTLLRYRAPDPSTWRDVGTLFMVMWLPAVGNLIAYVAGKLPRGAPPPPAVFAPGQAWRPHLVLHVTPVAPFPLGAFDGLADDALCTVIAGRHAFTARADGPLAQCVAGDGERSLPLELLRPEAARPHLRPGTPIHLLVGTTAIASGRVATFLAVTQAT